MYAGARTFVLLGQSALVAGILQREAGSAFCDRLQVWSGRLTLVEDQPGGVHLGPGLGTREICITGLCRPAQTYAARLALKGLSKWKTRRTAKMGLRIRPAGVYCPCWLPAGC